MEGKNKQIPVGYKDSPLGIIPAEWEVKRLGEMCINISSGKNKSKTENGVYPVYGSTGIIGYAEKYVYDKNVILVARVGANAGMINIATGKYDVSDNTLMIEPKDLYELEFAYNQLMYLGLSKLVFGSGQPLVTAGQLKALLVPLPPLPEQQRIAEVLGAWDQGIELQAKLVESLQKRKRALMQQLLTGKKRLKGFDQAWKKVKLGEIGRVLMCKRVLKNQTTPIKENNIPFYKIGTFGKEPDSFISRALFDELISKYSYPNEGDILISASGTIGRLVVFDGKEAYFQDSNIVWVGNNEKKILNNYLYYYYQCVKWQTSDGGIINRLYNSDLENVIIYTPSLPEQQAIAEILTAADREIELAQKKLEVLREQKRGLMQQLLTGKKRLKV